MNKLLWAAILSFVLVPESSAQFVNSKLKHGKRRIQVILVLPAQVSLAKAGIKGSEGMPEEGDKLGNDLYTLVCTRLSGYGAKVLANPLEADRSDTARYALAEIQRKYDTTEVQMLRNPRAVGKGRYTVGDSVASYAPAADADTLVYIRGSGTVLDRTEQLMGRIPGPWMWSAKGQIFDGRLVFVDARSGEVLVFVAFTTYGGWKKTAEELMPRIQNVMLHLPVPIYDFLGPSQSKPPRRPN
jgi:hypothetical protein